MALIKSLKDNIHKAVTEPDERWLANLLRSCNGYPTDDGKNYNPYVCNPYDVECEIADALIQHDALAALTNLNCLLSDTKIDVVNLHAKKGRLILDQAREEQCDEIVNFLERNGAIAFPLPLPTPQAIEMWQDYRANCSLYQPQRALEFFKHRLGDTPEKKHALYPHLENLITSAIAWEIAHQPDREALREFTHKALQLMTWTFVTDVTARRLETLKEMAIAQEQYETAGCITAFQTNVRELSSRYAKKLPAAPSPSPSAPAHMLDDGPAL